MDLIMTQLHQLKMAAMAKALELQQQNPHNYNGLSFEERLGLWWNKSSYRATSPA
uniref:Mobile element protein n=1 Tax=Rheinheimera sp. BAL341 TaxID=1708203 RepID=A0A486XMN0_9GAMM